MIRTHRILTGVRAYDLTDIIPHHSQQINRDKQKTWQLKNQNSTAHFGQVVTR